MWVKVEAPVVNTGKIDTDSWGVQINKITKMSDFDEKLLAFYT